MNLDFNQRYQSLRTWAAAAQGEGWLNAHDINLLDGVETASAQDLFEDSARRPLIVGLFGGTGVGKSSLLNRLAGEDIAVVGVERPTSRRATIYLHRSQKVSALPAHSPIGDTNIKYHAVDGRRDVAWLDMPDIDSVEQHNKALVLSWLPYVDWLIYVVSPERYRDDPGWQVLQQRHQRHHWLFVINRWDEAKDVQRHEFVTDLAAAGFAEPRVLRTSCNLQVEDDFTRLEKIIDAAIAEHGLAELQRIGVLARLEELDNLGQAYRQRIGTDEQWDELMQSVAAGIRGRLDLFKNRLESNIEDVVRHFPTAPGLWRKDLSSTVLPDIDLEQSLWSGYCDNLVDDIATAAVAPVDAKGLAGEPLSRRLQANLTAAKQTVLEAMGQSLNRALAAPGGSLRRSLRRTLDFVAFALPLGVAAWVSYYVVLHYQQGIQGDKEFLGLDFAVHSLMMIGLAWFLPFVLSRWLRPSIRSAARHGLRAGLDAAVETLGEGLTGVRTTFDQDRRRLLAEFSAL